MELENGFKNTELGLIPKDWKIIEFVEVMDGFSSGQTPYRAIKEFYSGDIPWITSGELNYNIIKDTLEKITTEAVKAANLKKIPKGTFLFAITGLEATGTRGSCAITGIEATTNQSCMALYPKKGKLTTKYLYHFYVKFGNDLALKYCQGTKQQSFTGAIAKKLPIIIPPTIKEQTAISKTIDDFDNLLYKLEKLIIKKIQIKQSTMQNLLMPKKNWDEKNLGAICSILKGRGISKSYLTNNGKTKCILYGELFTKYNEVIYEVLSSTDIEEGIFSKKGDILYPGSTTTTGIDLAKASTLLIDDILLGGDIIIVRMKNYKYNSIFLTYFLNQIKKNEIAQTTKGITIHHLYGKDLAGIDVQFPSIEEQNKIATILADMDTEIKRLEIKLEKLKKIKLGMLQNLLTGKIRLV